MSMPSVPALNQFSAAQPPMPATPPPTTSPPPNFPDTPQITISPDANVVTATLPSSGDSLAYSRSTMSYAVNKTNQYSIVGLGNKAWACQDTSTGISVAISPSGDVALMTPTNPKPAQLGNLNSPGVVAALAQILSPSAYQDLMTAMQTNDLSKTTVGQEFPSSTIQKLEDVQNQDTSAAYQAQQAKIPGSATVFGAPPPQIGAPQPPANPYPSASVYPGGIMPAGYGQQNAAVA